MKSVKVRRWRGRCWERGGHVFWRLGNYMDGRDRGHGAGKVSITFEGQKTAKQPKRRILCPWRQDTGQDWYSASLLSFQHYSFFLRSGEVGLENRRKMDGGEVDSKINSVEGWGPRQGIPTLPQSSPLTPPPCRTITCMGWGGVWNNFHFIILIPLVMAMHANDPLWCL